MKKFAVFGNPIEQSLSPTIHQMFAQQCDEVISYEKILAPEGGFIAKARSFLSQPDAVGCNVTMPFKLDAFNMAVVDDQAAKDAKAVNTLMKVSNGSNESNAKNNVKGFNTDGIGLVNDLLNNHIELRNKRVLLIGAGGAARGVISPLIEASIAHLTIANRTKEKAQQVADETGHSNIEVVALEDVGNLRPHIIINSTAASLDGELPCVMTTGLLDECDVVYDMVYKNSPTVFMREATSQGVPKSLDGLGMLVEQAAAAFTIWTSKQPDTNVVVNKIRNLINNM
ncbi:shikimate dehydrogenase [Alteromonas sp. A081]|uniref:shikimate dehydrogenase n=1 Tax=Alteromonas sp. A081 TaxID=3410269 RepID=UPI003B987879